VKKTKQMRTRRRSDKPLSKKVFAYFEPGEFALVKRAATAERRSLSSFVAMGAIDKARAVLPDTSS